MQAIGAEGVIPAECKVVVKQYVPEIMKAIVTLPPDEVNRGTIMFSCPGALHGTSYPVQRAGLMGGPAAGVCCRRAV